LVAASPAFSRLALAQAYPSRPVRWIVPFPAGGSTDLVARLMAEWLTARLGQKFIVENKPGGGTNIAVQAAVGAPPDGYTLLFAVSTNVINPSLYKALPFDFQRDIAPVAGWSSCRW
jgi:tripartite-type tricarboxylate transporter receptor subunit TctC